MGMCELGPPKPAGPWECGGLQVEPASLAQAAGRDCGSVRALKGFGGDTRQASLLVPLFTHSFTYSHWILLPSA